MKHSVWYRSRNGRNESGAVLIFFVLILTVLLIVAAFSIDIGFAQMRGAQAQRAADAAALAGAPYLPLGKITGTGADCGAYCVATAIATKNGFTTGQDDVVSVTPKAVKHNSQLQVTIVLHSPSFFASVVGVSTFNVTRASSATYSQNVHLGNASNVYGNEPDQPKFRNGPLPNINVQPNFWGNIDGPLSLKADGDPNAGLFCSNERATFGCNEPNVTALPGGTSNDNTLSNSRTYTYTISNNNPAGSAAATIDLFDPIFLNQAAPNKGVTDPSKACTDANLDPPGAGQYNSGSGNSRCTDDNNLGSYPWAYNRSQPAPPELGVCGDPGNSDNSLTTVPKFGSPESFTKGTKTGVKTAADADIQPAPGPAHDDWLACEAPDFPLTSFSVEDAKGVPIAACKPQSWDVAPASDVTLPYDNNRSPRNHQVPNNSSVGPVVPLYQVPNLGDASTTDPAVLAQREKQRVYDWMMAPPVAYPYSKIATGQVNPDTLVTDSKSLIQLPMEAQAYPPGRHDLPVGDPIRIAADNAWDAAVKNIHDAFRNWVSMPSGCDVPAGQSYKLVVETDRYVDDSPGGSIGNPGDWYRGRGSNSYSIRVHSGGAQSQENTQIGISPVDKQDIFTQLGGSGAGSSSYIARVAPSTGNRTLQLTFYDVGNIGAGGLTVNLFAANGGAAVPGRLSAAMQCNAGYTDPNAGGGVHTLTPTAGKPCEIYIPNVDALDGQELRINLPIPNSDTYSCAVQQPFDCWIKGNFIFDSGLTLHDTTMWTARMTGAPTRITK